MSYSRTPHALLDITPVDSEVETSDLMTETEEETEGESDSDIEMDEAYNYPYAPPQQENFYAATSGSTVRFESSPAPSPISPNNNGGQVVGYISTKGERPSGSRAIKGPVDPSKSASPRYISTKGERPSGSRAIKGPVDPSKSASPSALDSASSGSVISLIFSPNTAVYQELVRGRRTDGDSRGVYGLFAYGWWGWTDDRSARAVDDEVERTRREAASVVNRLQKTAGGRIQRQKAVPVADRQREIDEMLRANLGLLVPTKKPNKPSPSTGGSDEKPPPVPHPTQNINLSTSIPIPVRKLYPSHPLEDRPDAFFKDAFHTLYTDIHALCHAFFGYPNLLNPEWVKKTGTAKPWDAIGMMSEFTTFADLVAEEDPVVGGWEELVGKGSSRKFLVVGVIVKMLKFRVFDEGIYGGNVQEGEMMHGVERALIDREGFQRQTLRASTTRAILTNRPVTTNFYAQVASQTAQTFLMLQPLFDYLYSLPSTSDWELPPPMEFYQGLHDIISDAAYLSLCIRVSPTIFWWEETRPGTLFTAEEHTIVDAVSWQESKNAQLTLHVKDITAWRATKEKALAAVRKKLAEGKIYSHHGFAKVEQLENIKALRPAFATDAFRAKVKIAVWPAIKRFKEGHWKEEGTSLPAWEKRGMREIPMSTSLVLCYYGRVQPLGGIKPYQPQSLAVYMGLLPTTAEEKEFVERVNESSCLPGRDLDPWGWWRCICLGSMG
ncbi:hypothetical protein HYALB_00011188 [Hymenoscyphus albidus]|uniref:Uncharacterized protein n=1 Tax=Hymenoscyphus albidus TaxID=595503 RepID=A0A9N9LUN3_9HELO|nr:hypothetical protein HYALB_00011188 [Hymenoscyphus albidus]